MGFRMTITNLGAKPNQTAGNISNTRSYDFNADMLLTNILIELKKITMILSESSDLEIDDDDLE